MHPNIDPDRYQRLRNEAMTRAAELRRQAIDDAWAKLRAVFRRAVSRTAVRPRATIVAGPT
jgi:hypothetical protein